MCNRCLYLVRYEDPRETTRYMLNGKTIDEMIEELKEREYEEE